MKKYFVFFFAILALFIAIGSYSVINQKRAEEMERVRLEQVAKAEQDSKKIENKTFGYSTKGRPIEGYEIGNGANVLLLVASIHGNEMGATYLMDRFIEEIKANPNLISKSKKLVVIPIANPDGYYDRTDKLNANGVNLNLNFNTSDWQEYGPEGTYAGPQPFSEIESQVIRQTIEHYQPSMMIAYHARGAFVTPEANNASGDFLARWYADKTGYAYDGNDDIWDYAGTATRWFVETTGKAAITVELTKYLESDWEINKDALLELVSSNTLPISKL